VARSVTVHKTLDLKTKPQVGAKMTEAEKPSPKPPWRVLLKGGKLELEDMACTLRAGSVRVYGVHGIGFAYLEAEELNQIPSLNQVIEGSKALLRRLLGLRKLRGLVAGEVEPTAIDWTDDNGKWAKRHLFSSISINVVAAEQGWRLQSAQAGREADRRSLRKKTSTWRGRCSSMPISRFRTLPHA
jgi:hypothetical protein